jgi:hypothetical protein
MLPPWVKRSAWVAATILAVVGVLLVYVRMEDSLAWWVGSALVAPLVLLIIFRSSDSDEMPGPFEGPYGPP